MPCSYLVPNCITSPPTQTSAPPSTRLGVGRCGPRPSSPPRCKDGRLATVVDLLVARLPRGGSARSDLPCGIDDRVAELRQEAPVVEVPPRVEIGPMVGGDGTPSTPQHPAAPEDKADEAPPRVEVLRRAGAGKDTV